MALLLSDIAESCGTSVVVAAAALRGRGHVDPLLAARIRQTADDGGFVAPASWSVPRTKDLPTIGVLGLHHPEWHFGAGYYDEVLRGILTAAKESRHDVSIYVECNIPRLDACGGHSDGLILFKEQFQPEIFHAIKNAGIPTVTVGDKAEELPNVDVDNYTGAHAAVEHLIELGHRHIGAIRGNNFGDWADIRFSAYCHALKKADVAIDGSLIVDVELCDQLATYEAVVDMVQHHGDELPTAIVCPNDALAFSVIDALTHCGLRVPEDISVTGFDDLPEAATWRVPLTTVRQPMGALGVRAVQVLAALINRPCDAPFETRLPAELVVRGSTAPPANH